jgi:hypothetical protein
MLNEFPSTIIKEPNSLSELGWTLVMYPHNSGVYR